MQKRLTLTHVLPVVMRLTPHMILACTHGSFCKYILWFSYKFPIRSCFMGWTMSLTLAPSQHANQEMLICHVCA